MDFSKLQEAMVTLFTILWPPISSEAWTNLPAEDRAKLVTFVHGVNDLFNGKLRPAFDATIWAGNKTGKFVGNTNKAGDTDRLEPVRAETVKSKSADAKVPTAEELANAALGIVATPAEEVVTDVPAE